MEKYWKCQQLARESLFWDWIWLQKKKKGVLSLRKKNLFDKEKVVFVEDENDEENTDGVREPLEAIGKVKREG